MVQNVVRATSKQHRYYRCCKRLAHVASLVVTRDESNFIVAKNEAEDRSAEKALA
jgi:hypothetical protein